MDVALAPLPFVSSLAGPIAGSLAGVPPIGASPSWLLLAMSVCAVIYFTLRPRKKDPLARSPFRNSLAQQKALERDMQNVIVELSEMTRQMSAQLETRAAKLEQLMRDADAVLAELRQATADASPLAASPQSSPPTSNALPSHPALRLVTDADHCEDRWAEVYRLGEQGLTLPQIARQLGRPHGEIELILALRPRNRPQPGHGEPDVEVSEPPNIASAR